MKKLVSYILIAIAFSSCNSRQKTELVTSCSNAEATCYGSKNCSACKNCKYCKHCSKNGGNCGVCK